MSVECRSSGARFGLGQGTARERARCERCEKEPARAWIRGTGVVGLRRRSSTERESGSEKNATTAADEKRAAGGGGDRDAPRFHEHVGHLGQVGVQVLRLWGEGIDESDGQGNAAGHGREPGVEAAARCQSIGGEIGGDSADVSRREARVSQSVRARTVLEGVIFLALASAFIALRVSLSPFASRYASTAGTRSAAFALHRATVGFVATASRRNQVCADAAPKRGGRFKRKRRVFWTRFFWRVRRSRACFS